LQRDIEVETTELRFGPTDQQTTFLGHIYFNGRNVAEELIEQGLARVVSSLPPVAKKGKKKQIYGYQNETQAIPENFRLLEEKAQEQQIGIWENYKKEEAKENAENADENAEAKNASSLTGKERNVTITHIDTAATFWVNVADKDVPCSLEEMEEKMSKIPNKKQNKIRLHDVVAALYEGLYARAVTLTLIVRDDDVKEKDKKKRKRKKR